MPISVGRPGDARYTTPSPHPTTPDCRDCKEWKLLAINPHDRNVWRSDVRSAMRAASQLSGREPTDVDVAPVPACLIKKLIMMMI